MNKNLILSLVLIILIIGGYFIFFNGSSKPQEETPEDLTLETVRKEENDRIHKLRITDATGREQFVYSIEDFNQWAAENWEDLFQEPPRVGGRQVNTNFSFFNDNPDFAPSINKIVFFVNDYAAATTVSFIGVVDINSGETNLIPETIRGGVGNYVWSTENQYLAYKSNTARAVGDYIYVDDIKNMERSFTLSRDDVLQRFNTAEEESPTGFNPEFRNLEWKNNYLHFSSTGLDKKEVQWKIDKEGSNLTRK